MKNDREKKEYSIIIDYSPWVLLSFCIIFVCYTMLDTKRFGRFFHNRLAETSSMHCDSLADGHLSQKRKDGMACIDHIQKDMGDPSDLTLPNAVNYICKYSSAQHALVV